jgi:hypothetical protein
MWKTRTVTAAVALAAAAAAFAAVRSDLDERPGVRGERTAREARVALPRTAGGAIDVPKLIVELRAAITRGARDIRFQDATLSASDAATLRELSARFGFEGVRIREGGHRVRVDFRDTDRDGLRKRVDAEGRERARGPERIQKVERAERPEKNERAEKAERPERGERPERSGRH